MEKENALAPKAEADYKYHSNAFGMLMDKDNSRVQRWSSRVTREVLVKLSTCLVADGGMRNVAYQEKVLPLSLCWSSLLGVGSSCTFRTRQTVESLSLDTLAHGVLRSQALQSTGFPLGITSVFQHNQLILIQQRWLPETEEVPIHL